MGSDSSKWSAARSYCSNIGSCPLLCKAAEPSDCASTYWATAKMVKNTYFLILFLFPLAKIQNFSYFCTKKAKRFAYATYQDFERYDPFPSGTW